MKKEIIIDFCLVAFIVIIFLCPRLVLAQEKKKDKLKVIAKFTPLGLLTPETPALGIGAELWLPKFDKHGLAIEFDWGFRCARRPNGYPYNIDILDFPELDPNNYYDKHYNKYHLEFRKYFRRNKLFSWYLATEGFYIPYTYQAKDGYFRGTDHSIQGYGNAHVNKWIRGGYLKFGLVIMPKSHFTFEYFAGPGLRFVNVRYSNVTSKLYGNYSMEDYAPQEGKKVAVHLALGIRVGYRLSVAKKTQGI